MGSVTNANHYYVYLSPTPFLLVIAGRERWQLLQPGSGQGSWEWQVAARSRTFSFYEYYQSVNGRSRTV